MTLIDCRNLFRNVLQPICSSREADLYYKMLLEHHFDWDATFLGLHPQHLLTERQLSILEQSLSELKQERPIQQIIEWTWFRDIKLRVSPDVLIPRPETEELVDWVLEDYKTLKESKSVLDVCTGSGCVAIALAKDQQHFCVEGIDVSKKALAIANENARHCQSNITFFYHDILNTPLKKTYNIMVSNPPYIGWDEKETMEKKVLAYEPHLALFAPKEDPLLFYDVILEQALTRLTPQGRIYFEINPLFLDTLTAVIKSKAKFDMSIRKDIFGKNRLLRLTRI